MPFLSTHHGSLLAGSRFPWTLDDFDAYTLSIITIILTGLFAMRAVVYILTELD